MRDALMLPESDQVVIDIGFGNTLGIIKNGQIITISMTDIEQRTYWHGNFELQKAAPVDGLGQLLSHMTIADLLREVADEVDQRELNTMENY